MSYWYAGAMFVRYSIPNDFSAILPVSMAAVRLPAETPHVYENLNGYYEARRVPRPHWRDPNMTTYYHAGQAPNGSFDLAKPTLHFDGVNTLYADGHVKWVSKPALYEQMCPQWTPGNKGSTDCTAPTEM